jgi:hypothetical protein
MGRLLYQYQYVLKHRETILKNSNFFFISVTLKSWSGRKLLDPPRTASLKVQKCHFLLREYLYVLYVSQKKIKFPYTALTD